MYAAGSQSFLAIDAGYLDQNAANVHGGAIYIELADDGLAVILGNGTSVYGNMATLSNSSGGGVIYMVAVGDVMLSIDGGAVLLDNHAALGGVMYIEACSSVHMLVTGGSIIGQNVANVAGGVFYISACTGSAMLEVTDGSSVDGNTASSDPSSDPSDPLANAGGDGGVLYLGTVAGGASIWVGNNSTVSNNNADGSGGVAFVGEGSVSVLSVSSGAHVDNNSAAGRGGGVLYIDNGGAGVIEVSSGGTLSQNQATYYGGVAYLPTGSVGQLSVEGPGSAINQSDAGGNGGAIMIQSGSLGSMVIRSGAQVDGNAAGNDGGFAFVGSGLQNITIADGGELGNNHAYAGNGGAVASWNDAVPCSVVVQNGSTADGNTAATFGGMLYVSGAKGVETLLVENSSSVSKNNADQGGAVYASVLGALRVTGNSVMVDNYATFSDFDRPVGGGGAVYVVSAGAHDLPACPDLIGTPNVGTTIDISGGSSLSGNTAESYGGAFFLATGVASIVVDDGSGVDSNTAAAGSGGAFFLGSTYCSFLTVSRQSSMSYNHARFDGGAVAAAGDICNLKLLNVTGGSWISDNYAYRDGGVAYMQKGENVAIVVEEGSSILRNYARGHGGVVNVDNGGGGSVQINVTGGAIVEGNYADVGGVLYVDYDTLGWEGRVVLHVGSGARVARNAAMDGSGGVIHGTGSLDVLVDTGGTVMGNAATSNGGAFSIAGVGNFSVVDGGAVEGNTAQGEGGVLYVVGFIDLLELRAAGRLNGNLAQGQGGAVWAIGITEVVIEGSYVQGNTAVRDGGVLCATDMDSVRLVNATVSNNVVLAGNGGFLAAGYVQSISASGTAFANNSASLQGGVISLIAAPLVNRRPCMISIGRVAASRGEWTVKVHVWPLWVLLFLTFSESCRHGAAAPILL